MKVSLAQKGGMTEVMVEGEVDYHSAQTLRMSLLDAIKSPAGEIRVVLAAVDYMDSSGMATLLEAKGAAEQLAKSFCLKDPSEAVAKILQMTKLDTVFAILQNAHGESG